jgi:hypothetical protein
LGQAASVAAVGTLRRTRLEVMKGRQNNSKKFLKGLRAAVSIAPRGDIHCRKLATKKTDSFDEIAFRVTRAATSLDRRRATREGVPFSGLVRLLTKTIQFSR